MAEIRIEPRRSGRWPWVVGLLVVALAAAAAALLLDRGDDAAARVDAASPAAAP